MLFMLGYVISVCQMALSCYCFFVMIFFGLSLAVTAQIQTMTNGSARNPQEIKIDEHRMQYNTTSVHAQLLMYKKRFQNEIQIQKVPNPKNVEVF